jgi:CDP-diacylglycerol--glycerol-3-phosphate 3-phosphatidyltransferase
MSYFIHSLTLSRILFGPIIFGLILSDKSELAFILFCFASLSDYFDGFLARKYHLESTLGEVLDPIADKILVVFISMAIALQLQSFYVGFLSCILLSREFWVSALRDLNARNHRQEATKVTFLAKIKTAIQLFALSLYLISFIFHSSFLLFIAHIHLFLALIITIHTGLSYTMASLKK